ncbi:MAG: hypothetical protein LKJ76_07470 [Lachnospiraceae bacterium]|jgi:hypothetical protein|nr:hypothetical protein [Lachnospiraceae bacterium]
MDLFLTLLSGIAWTVVYIECIRKGFKEKTCCMPLFALGLNVAWEFIYTMGYIAQRNFGAQGIINIVWSCCDVIILVTCFKFGAEYFPVKEKKHFIFFCILCLFSCFALQMAFYLPFSRHDAAQYSAFAQNVVMSVLFVFMLLRRGSTRGQSMTIAVAKWIGTLAPTIQRGILREFNIYVLLCGIICTVWDILYILMLWKKSGTNNQDGAV